MANGFSLDAQGLISGLASAGERTDAAFRMYANTSALQLQNYARENRKWTDRTGAARQRLEGSSYPIQNGYRIQLAHGVDYGIWLELAHEKRFAIIEPTIWYVGANKILPGLQRLLERLG